MIEITGGRIYLEVDGVTQDDYYNQVYKAQEAAIQLSMRTKKDVTIRLPAQVVRYVNNLKTVRISWQQARDTQGQTIVPLYYSLRIVDVDDNLVQELQIDGNLLSTELQLDVGPYTVEVSATNDSGTSEWSDKLTMLVE